jgi:RNA polymerase sigma-70 factor (ECF subfamily)
MEAMTEALTKATVGDASEVIASAAAGDEVAFGRIVAAHHGEMVRVCHVVSRDAAIADEAAQAAWSIAWRKLGSLRQPESLRPWLIAVAVNEARKLLRKRARRSEMEVSTDVSMKTGSVDPATGIAFLDLEHAVARLEPDDRALLALRYVAGFDATELSRALGISPAGVRQRLKRLLGHLRRDLEHG